MTDQTDPSLAELTLRFVRAVRRRHAAILSEHGLYPGQDTLLLAAWRRPGLRMSDLAEEMGVEPPTVTRMVERLSKGGLVERQQDPDDGRSGLIFPTPRSRILEPVVKRALSELDDQLDSAFGSGPLASILSTATARLTLDRER